MHSDHLDLSNSDQLLAWASSPSDSIRQDAVLSIVHSISSLPSLADSYMQAYQDRQTVRLRSCLVAWAVADLEPFLDSCLTRYSEPTSRANLTLLLLAVLLEIPYIPGQPPNDTLMARMGHHSLVDTLLDSLTFDRSNILFPLSLRLFLAILPYAPQHFTRKVPIIMIIVGRAIYWRDRKFPDREIHTHGGSTLTPKAAVNLGWKVCADSPPAGIPPSLDPVRIVRLLLVAVYNAWPSNLIAFVRDPVAYLKGKSTEERYDIPWDQVWEPGLLAKRAGPLLRNFHLHPSLCHFSSSAELADTARWDKNDPSYFVTRSHMLAHSEVLAGDKVDLFEDAASTVDSEVLQESLPPSTAQSANSDTATDELTRTNEILRLEATFGDRIRKLYLYNIGKLHEQTLRVASDEAEIHGFVNRLKEQTRAITTLTIELTQQKAEASQAQQRHAKQHDHLYEKLSTFREERRTWQLESTRLRGELSETSAAFKRQQDELAAVKNERFILQNQLTEAAPKIQHLEDYEIRMQQLTDSQRLWDADVRDASIARAEAESYRLRIHELDTLLRAIRLASTDDEARPAHMALAVPTPPPPNTLQQIPNVDFYIAIADKAKRKAELLERENLELRAKLSISQVTSDELDAQCRPALWKDN